MSANKVTFGLEQVHIAFVDAASLTPPEWEAPQAVKGAVSFTPSPENEENVFYADNGAYYVVTGNNGYTGDLEMALIPDDIMAEMLGWWIDTNGMVVEDANGVPKEFAIMGQVQGDAKNRRFVYYRCIAQRPSKEHSTKGESLEPATDSLTLKMLPIDMTIGTETKKIVKGVMELNDTNPTAYNAFFTAVTKPTTAAV